MKPQKKAEVKSKNEASQKTAIIYCRAADMETAKRQQVEAETKAKELNATVKAVFIDINPTSKPILRRRFVRYFIKKQRQQTDKHREWRTAMEYLKAHKTDYAITQSSDRIVRGFIEVGEMENSVRQLGARVIYYASTQEDLDTSEAFLGECRKCFRRYSLPLESL